ncbi:MAG: hypothetical protein JOZ10_18615 [Acidobacteria bacterium]|nr:hypothetical protein [Acidobacteriota bacterium]MBV9148020.1 hypothetical protein [Acidobacteriota bacterium]MBV9437895.1 hypothetical protein [Acidobacteriota bacterium]
MFQFGSGTLWGYPISGNLAANPTPIKFGTLQEVDIEISGSVKELYGQNQFADAVARGKCKITGKAKYAQIIGKHVNDLFFGQTMSAGQKLTAVDEAQSVPGGSPYTVTVTNSAQFADDWGVRYAATGLPLTRVSSAPVQAQYAVSAGVYTFASADAGAAVLISYRYTTAAGVQLNIRQQLMGFAPTFQILLNEQYAGKQANLLLYSCVADKLTFSIKNEDFVVPEFDFEAFASPSGQVMDLYLAE